jgi:surface polysaccharide O-acyltransferase-like enzyme
MPSAEQQTIIIQAAHTILFNIFCLSSLLAGAAFFQRKVNGTARVWKSLAASSYGIYYVHPLILYPLAYIFVPISLPLFLKGPIVMVLGIVLSWGVSSLVLKRIPVLRWAF